MKLEGQHALVTGGATGIGLAISQALVREGAQVTIASRNIDRLNEVAASNDAISAVALDITDSKNVASVFQTLDAVDILVNNAGAAHTAPFHRTTDEAWNFMLNVNLTGTFFVTKAALKGMREKGQGRIINIASTAGLKGYSYIAAYNAAKHGVIGMTKSLALELAETGITANCVCPGFTETDMVEDAIKNITAKTGRSQSDALAELLKHNPQERLVAPEEVAEAVLWLAQDESRSVTGQSIVVAGGEIM